MFKVKKKLDTYQKIHFSFHFTGSFCQANPLQPDRTGKGWIHFFTSFAFQHFYVDLKSLGFGQLAELKNIPLAAWKLY